MEKFDKWYLPSGEEHLQGWMQTVNNRQSGRLTYQYGKYAAAMPFFKERRVCVDVGSHVGLWAWFMARDFEDVACFEPMPEHRECWHINMKDRPNAELYDCALGAEKGFVTLETRTAGSSGDTGVVANDGNTELRTLDEFNFDDVDLIKIDTEGFELNVLNGAIYTLKRCKPCVIVEQKGDMSLQYGHDQLSAVRFLEKLGAKQRLVISGDYIMSWDK